MSQDQEIARRDREIERLNKRIDDLLIIIENQNKKIEALESEIERIKTKKTSRNSSLPPSSDIGKPIRKNLRESTGRKPGGQPGHEGKTLKMVSNPDEIIEHGPIECESCGKNLENVAGEIIDSRQVIDIPPISAIYIEHRLLEKVCRCGHCTRGKFPSEVKQSVQYGSGIVALIAYFSVRQYIPFLRMKEMLADVLGIFISTGGIRQVLKRMAKNCAGKYEAIKAEIEISANVGSDETGAVVNGENGWFWVWQNKFQTFIAYSSSRGFEVINKLFPNGFPKTILSHDCWAAQFKCEAKGHQICLTHILRDLNFNIDAYSCKWSEKVKWLIKDCFEIKSVLTKRNHGLRNPAVEEIENRMDELLDCYIPEENKKSITLRKRFKKQRKSIFQFLYYPEVPADNNGSERAIRNIKVKQKISGQFKSEEGAQDFAVIRSVIDTAIKSGEEILDYLTKTAKLGTE